MRQYDLDPYRMALHEFRSSEGVGILRVPGGWLYYYQDDYNHYISPTFVPYCKRDTIPCY